MPAEVKASEAIKTMRRKDAQQAARDVLKLLPTDLLHISNDCYYLILPMTPPEPKLVVYQVGTKLPPDFSV